MRVIQRKIVAHLDTLTISVLKCCSVYLTDPHAFGDAYRVPSLHLTCEGAEVGDLGFVGIDSAEVALLACWTLDVLDNESVSNLNTWEHFLCWDRLSLELVAQDVLSCDEPSDRSLPNSCSSHITARKTIQGASMRAEAAGSDSKM